MSVAWEYNSGWVGYNKDQSIALGNFRDLLAELGSEGWELVNFQVVTWGSEGGGEGVSQGTSGETSEATSWNENAYKALVKEWRSSGSASQEFSHTFSQRYHLYTIWYVFKRPA
jgi:hypothetical protein